MLLLLLLISSVMLTVCATATLLIIALEFISRQTNIPFSEFTFSPYKKMFYFYNNSSDTRVADVNQSARATSDTDANKTRPATLTLMQIKPHQQR
jgi:hypothetical protein